MRVSFKLETIILIVDSVILFGLFVYKVGYSALTSYDEAWYGEISRNLTLFKNPFKLTFNGQIFTDHPPLGYLLMAVPTLIFGSNEFSVRVVSVLLGVGTVLLMYFLGKRMSGRVNGIAAAAILTSCMWFMLRVRSGNLDIPFMFFEVLTVYLLLSKSSKALFLAAISFAALILTKTLAGFGLIPLVLFLIWSRRSQFKAVNYLIALLLFLVIVLPWYVFNQLVNPNFFYHHFVEIGMRGGKNSYGWGAATQNFWYTAIGIGKWYKVFLGSIFLGALCFIKQKKERFSLAVLFFWFLGFSPFLFSSETEIWHLTPLYPIIALVIAIGTFSGAEMVLPKKLPVKLGVLAATLFLAVYQFLQFSNLIYFKEPVFSMERDISQKAGAYDRLYLMDTFFPAAVYYSHKTINPLHWHPEAYSEMVRLLKAKTGGVFIINREFRERLARDKVSFVVVDKNDSYYLITE
jgi:4-amino-4-deoxy-L-arabinose transferase-like glycosyltransferase